MNLRYSEEFVSDLELIKTLYETEYNTPGGVRPLIKEILEISKTLLSFPLLGTSLKDDYGIEQDYRFLKCRHYLIFYIINEQNIDVLRVLDGRSNYLKVLFNQ